MFVDECAEAVGPFAERSKEGVLGLCLNIVEEWRCEDAVTAIHKSLFVVVVHIDVAVGLFPDIVAIGIFAACVVVERFDGFVDDLIDEFPFVGEEVLNAVVFGGDDTL